MFDAAPGPGHTTRCTRRSLDGHPTVWPKREQLVDPATRRGPGVATEVDEHRQSVKNAMISIASPRSGIIPVEVARPRAGGSGRSDLAVGTSRAAGPRRYRR